MLEHPIAYINHAVKIRPAQVWKDGSILFDKPDQTDFFRYLYDACSGQYPKFHKMDPLAKLGWLGSEILLQGIDFSRYQPEDIAVILSNRSSSQHTDEKYYKTIENIASPALFVYTLPNIVIGEISIRHKFKGENSFFIFDTFDTVSMHGYVNALFASNQAEACLCGWVEYYDDRYEAVLYWLEKDPQGLALPLEEQELKKLYLK
ncbi:3-oxoacyl-ACP synthase [Chitinophaga caeni]|uniref:3-oxoacyl-ACP synthase n=1 Tax=Chitinophaga caeni TaxID=2029983 RepID=A0A291QUH8_9BACT|nr:3-oxoacyl-ACP synthase [Chitinophaga caeni]